MEMAAYKNLYDDYFRQFPPLPTPIIPYPNQPHRSYIDDLNDTLLELIFTKLLQWKHLVTCKCVSKRWNLIISNPYFARYYLTHKLYSAFTLILIDPYDDDFLISEHPYFQKHKLRLNDNDLYYIVAHHNDMLVSCDSRNSSSAEFSYKICNPLTKQFTVVTATNNYYRFYRNCKVGFAGFVNGVSSTNNVVIGFRIILVNKDYYYKNKLTWKIYSSVTGKWKTYNNVKDLGFVFRSKYQVDPRNQAVTSNNRVHWRGKSNKILVMDPFVDDIVSYCVINLPSVINCEDSVLGSCQNRLRLAQLEPDYVAAAPRIKVWEFEQDDDGLMMNWGGNSMAKLRLVINFALKPHIIARVFPPIEGLFSSCLRLKNEVICCHSIDPYIVYLMYGDKLVECDVGMGRLRLIHHCTYSWCHRYMLVHPLMAS
ncbi:uncharacterized protein LOC141597540 [Silene latifolia]|uniref:uncharacterized protein LOC141597540 n=1 Tax=Silene latifolia TaxID=37657 RepID=UPI003D779DBF